MDSLCSKFRRSPGQQTFAHSSRVESLVYKGQERRCILRSEDNMTGWPSYAKKWYTIDFFFYHWCGSFSLPDYPHDILEA